MPSSAENTTRPSQPPAVFSWPGGNICVPKGRRQSQCVKVEAFDLVPGTIVCLHGDSGCGKSTFLAHLAGVADYSSLPNSSQMRMEALRVIEGFSFVYVPQFPQFDRELSIRTECLYQWGRVYDGMSPSLREQALGREKAIMPSSKALEARLDELLPVFFPLKPEKDTPALRAKHIAELKGKRISELSGGQLKRLGLLLRLPFHADIFLLDEPDSGVDQETAITIMKALKTGLSDKAPPAILMVSHSLAVSEAVQTKTVKMEPLPRGASACSTANQCDMTGCARITSQSGVIDGDYSPAAWSKDCLHQLKLMFGTPGNFTMCVVPPILIFLVLKISGWDADNQVPFSKWSCDGCDGSDANTAAKFLFFGVVASMWLNLQLSSRMALGGTLVRKEQFWWTRSLLEANLEAKDKQNLHYYCAWDMFWSMITTSAIIAMVVAVCGVAAFYALAPYGWLPVDWNAMPHTAIYFIGGGYFAGALYGGVLGLVLGLVLAVVRMSSPRLLRRWITAAKPNSNWLVFAVPLLTLLHIVFSPIFIYGTAFWESGGGTLGRRLVIANPCAAALGLVEWAFVKLPKDISQLLSIGVGFYGATLLILLVTSGALATIVLKSKEVRA